MTGQSSGPLHYGPWLVTVTDGDTAMHHEVYASTEEQACAEVMETSDLYIRTYVDEVEQGDRDVTVTARRIP